MRRLLERLAVLALLSGGLVAAVPAVASADVVFDETAQEAFGVDENGESTGSGPMSAAWRAFIAQEEGRRIMDDLEDSDTVVTIQVLSEEQVGDGDAWGTTQGTEWDETDTGWVATEIVIELADNPLSPGHAAGTLHHELRHAEIKAEGGSLDFQTARHDQLHAERDSLNDRFELQLQGWQIDQATRDPFLEDETPIYDSIKARADDDRRLSHQAEYLGDLFSSEPEAPTITFGSVVGVRLDGGLGDGTNGTAGAGCGREDNGKTMVCPDAASDLKGEILGIGIQFDTVIPLDASIEVLLDMDTDGDPANDRPGAGDDDPTRGTDTTIGATFDPLTGWTMAVETVDGIVASGSRVVVEADSMVFLIPMAEVPGGSGAGFRVTVDQVTEDGTTSRETSESGSSLASVPSGAVPAGCGAAVLSAPCGGQDHLNVRSVFGHIDDAGDLWLEFEFELPWTMAPAVDLPSTALFWSLAVDGMGVGGGQWAIHDGTTFGISGFGEEVGDLEMYLSPWGTAFVRLPGRDQPAGYSLAPGHTYGVQITTRHQLELDVETFDRNAQFPLTGARVMMGFTGPGADWSAIVPDIGPVTLSIPSG